MARLQFRPGAVRVLANREARKSVRNTTAAINRAARRNAPGGTYSTGRLKNSINWSVRTAGWNVRGQSGSDLDYAIFPERGTRPHLILPRRAPHLRFYWRKVGHVVRMKSVNHPGQRAQNFLTDALIDVAPRYGYKVIIYS